MVAAFWGLEYANIWNHPPQWKSWIPTVNIPLGYVSMYTAQNSKLHSDLLTSRSHLHHIHLPVQGSKQICLTVSICWPFNLVWLQESFQQFCRLCSSTSFFVYFFDSNHQFVFHSMDHWQKEILYWLDMSTLLHAVWVSGCVYQFMKMSFLLFFTGPICTCLIWLMFYATNECI